MKAANLNVNQMQVVVTTNNVAMKMNADMNANNLLTKVYVMQDLFGMQVIVVVNVINHMMLKNIYTMKIVNVGKNQLISQLKNVKKTMMETK